MYKTPFGKDFDLGIRLNQLPTLLVDNSYGNDVCPSFYFKIHDEYYLLWIDYEDKEQREDPDAYRYIVVKAINEGDDKYLDIYSDSRMDDLLQTDDKNELANFIVGLTEKIKNK